MKIPLLGLSILAASSFAWAANEFAGSYVIVDGQRNSKPIGADRFKDISVRIDDNTITTYDGENKEVYVASYKIDSKGKPARITMTAKVTPPGQERGTVSKGLLGWEGESLKLVYALPKGSTPHKFEAGHGQQMFVLRKVDKKPATGAQ